MSIILDALRKSEHERDRRRLPGLAQAAKPHRRRSRLVWVLSAIAALLATNLVVLTVILMRPNRAPTVAAAPVTTPALTPAAPATRTTAAVTVAATHGPLRPLSEEAATAGRTSPYSDVPAPMRAPTVTAPPAVPPAHTVPTATTAVRTTLASAETSTAGLPTQRQLPAALAGALPPLTVDLHVFSSDPARRFMVISGQRALEGATVAGGVVIERITPDGAIAVFRGTRFLLTRE